MHERENNPRVLAEPFRLTSQEQWALPQVRLSLGHPDHLSRATCSLLPIPPGNLDRVSSFLKKRKKNQSKPV